MQFSDKIRLEMDTYVVDTHALVWFISEDKRLSLTATQILSQAEAGEVQVLIPTLVLAELTHIAQKKKIAVTIEKLLEKINQGDGFNIVSFDFPIFQTMLQLPENWDIHDRIIAATASYYQAILITRDEMLRDCDEVKTVWD
jgi:predicted nucleic acid-binding protein